MCVKEKAARYLNALSQILNDGHMFIKHRLQTEDFLAVVAKRERDQKLRAKATVLWFTLETELLKFWSFTRAR